jgi:hypothetical protein
MSAETRNPRRLEMDHGGSTCCSVYRRECGGWEPPKGGPCGGAYPSYNRGYYSSYSYRPCGGCRYRVYPGYGYGGYGSYGGYPVTGDIQATADTAIAVGMAGKQ